MPTSTATNSMALGSGGQAPGSRGLRFLNCSSSSFIGFSALGRGLGRRLARLAGVLGLESLQAYVHVEFGYALAAHIGRLDFDQIGVLEVRRSPEIAHQRGNSGVGLGVT